MAPSKWIAAVLTGNILGLAPAIPTSTSGFVRGARLDDVSLVKISSGLLFGQLTCQTQSATGFASQTGGTTGGAGGITTTVSSYTAFTNAVSGYDAKLVVVSGTITKTADQARMGSNTSIIGINSDAILENFGMCVTYSI